MIIVLFFVLCIGIEFLIHRLESNSNTDSFGAGILLAAVFTLFTLFLFPNYQSTYYTVPKTLEMVNDGYIRTQDNNTVLKWDGSIHVVPSEDVYTIHSDSSYFEIKYRKQTKSWSKFQKLWSPLKDVNDTIIKESKYLLYRDLNE